jgi:carbon storage regulator CsrA
MTMLILARRQEESIVITTPTGEEIKILVMDAYHGFARLGIDAPADYSIATDELLPAKEAG